MKTPPEITWTPSPTQVHSIGLTLDQARALLDLANRELTAAEELAAIGLTSILNPSKLGHVRSSRDLLRGFVEDLS